MGWAQLERLRGSLDPTTLFQTVPGIGPELAQRIHDTLGILWARSLVDEALATNGSIIFPHPS